MSMEILEHSLEEILESIASIAIIAFEFVGVGIIIYSGITALLKMVRRDSEVKIHLAKGLAMGLEFKMGSEILRTVIVREWAEIGIVAGIIALRAGLAFLIHWEIREAEKEAERKEHETMRKLKLEHNADEN